MNRTERWVLCLWVNGVHAENHFFKVPQPTEKGFYRQAVSMDAMRNREAERFYKWTRGSRKTQLWKRGHIGEIDFMFMYSKRTEALIGPDERLFVPAFNHETIFDVYTAIGYDYKTKRYIKDQNTDSSK